MPTRVKDIQTKSKVVTGSTIALTLGGQVPTGMKRWVTFLSANTMLHTAMSNFSLYLASVGVSGPTKASLIATGNRKFLLRGRATQTSGQGRYPVKIPYAPQPDTPLFSIASAKWLGVYASLATVNVTVQYFDE